MRVNPKDWILGHGSIMAVVLSVNTPTDNVS